MTKALSAGLRASIWRRCDSSSSLGEMAPSRTMVAMRQSDERYDTVLFLQLRARRTVRFQIAQDELNGCENMAHDRLRHHRLGHVAHRVVIDSAFAEASDPGHRVIAVRAGEEG